MNQNIEFSGENKKTTMNKTIVSTSIKTISKLAFVVLVSMFISTNVQASTSSIIIDANTGEVLSAQSADTLRYPASLTKLMTLYITFDALERGIIKLEDELPVSRKAANRSPSRLGLRVGSKIPVKTAIEALIVKSANDCASVLAEGLGYTEENFAKAMTQIAKELGMKHTTFKNASGLPNRQQKTTARDMAILAAAIYHHFPQYYKWFSMKKFSYQGKTYYTHNHVLSKFEGADGLKTGFTNAAGFNIITSAERNGQRVIAVTMGHRTLKARDKKVMSMMEKGLTKLALNTKFAPESMHAELIEEHKKPTDIQTQLASREASIEPQSTEEDATPEIEQGSTDQEQSISAIEKEVQETTSTWEIQIGAFSNYARARSYAAKIHKEKFKKCNGCSIKVEAAESASAILYRAKITGFEKNDADKACKRLKDSHMSCIVMSSNHQTDSLHMASR